MSLRYEQYRALWETRRFLRELGYERKPIRTKETRDRARRCLRHFPFLFRTGAPLFSKDDFDTPPLSHGTNDSERG
jgi:hypothetical protein